MADGEVSRITELSQPRAVHPDVAWDRDFLKVNIHACANCGKPKKGGRCPDCARNAAKKKELAVVARALVFQAPKAERREKHQNGFGKVEKEPFK